MRIAVLRGSRRFEMADEPVPKTGPDEVLLRVASCGVCASELDMWTGQAGEVFPRYPGHEVSGVVEEAGPESGWRPGDPVAAWVTERGFAEYVAVGGDRCAAAGDVPLHLALGEPLGCAVNAVELAAPALGDDVLIVGAGFMGNLVQLLTQLRGPARVVVADTRPDALARAARLGATDVIDVTRRSLPEAVAGLTGGRGADVTFEVTGTQAALAAAGDVTRMSGTLAIVGFHQGGTREIPMARWNWMAFQIANAHFREASTILHGMRAGMRLLASGRLTLEGLVTHSFPLAQIDAAFQTAHDKPEGFVKAVVQP
jgi:L-iditol 2-dehydrogenase